MRGTGTLTGVTFASPMTERTLSTLTIDDPGFLEAMAAEELDPELQDYVYSDPMFGRSLKHPLIYELGLVLPGMANRRYAQKKKSLAEAVAYGNVHHAVWLHERPYRFDALMEYVIQTGSIWHESAKTIDTVLDVWVDSENIEQYQEQWLELFDLDHRPTSNGRKRVLGNRVELASFRKLPEELKVYRGGGDSSFITWTTHREVAERFANFSKRGVRERTVQKDGCFAYMTRRGEFEVLTLEGMGT